MIRRAFILGLGMSMVASTFQARAEHGNSTGINGTTITIGIHVPTSGAAPVEARAVRAGATMYWRYIHEQLGVLIHGRSVQVVMENDTYTPSTAVQKCNEMAQVSFLLLGFVGTDQINACANFADPRGIPYFSPGAQESGLRSRRTYAALSATWPQQAPIVTQYIANVLGEGADRYEGNGRPIPPPPQPCEPFRVPLVNLEIENPFCREPGPQPPPNPHPDAAIQVGLVRPNTPNYDDTDDAIRAALDAAGIGYSVYTTVKEGNSDEAQRIPAEMQRHGIDVVVLMSAPVFASHLVGYAQAAGYDPFYEIIGINAGINAYLVGVCEENGVEGSAFMPWPAWSAMAAGEFDPAFAAAANLYASDLNTAHDGDILVAMWGLMKSVHLMLETLGEHPTREDLIAQLDAGYSHETGVYPQFSVDAGRRFGAPAVHRLEASCDGEPQWHQADAFVTGYPADD